MAPDGKIAAFLFAHQDDESGVFQSIKSELASGSRVKCLYFTSGTADGEASLVRDMESRSVLLKLGVNSADIHFLGGQYKIPDGKLVNYMTFCADLLHRFLMQFNGNVKVIFLPAWEGGHPDHDALHAIGVLVSQALNILENTRQFPLYNRLSCSGPLFRVMLPLKDNGLILARKISLNNKLFFLKLCLSYPSQLKTWIGLFPFFLMHYFIYGVEYSQEVSYGRIFQRPHSGMLYYEKRNFYTYAKIREDISNFASIWNLKKCIFI